MKLTAKPVCVTPVKWDAKSWIWPERPCDPVSRRMKLIGLYMMPVLNGIVIHPRSIIINFQNLFVPVSMKSFVMGFRIIEKFKMEVSGLLEGGTNACTKDGTVSHISHHSTKYNLAYNARTSL